MGFFTKDIATLDDLFVHTLRDIYYAEKKIANIVSLARTWPQNTSLRPSASCHSASM